MEVAEYLRERRRRKIFWRRNGKAEVKVIWSVSSHRGMADREGEVGRRRREDFNTEMVEEEFKEVHCSCNPETFMRLLNMAK